MCCVISLLWMKKLGAREIKYFRTVSASHGQGGLSSTRGQVVTPQPISLSWSICRYYGHCLPLRLTSLSPCACISAPLLFPASSSKSSFLIPSLSVILQPLSEEKVKVLVTQSCLTLRPHGLKPTRLFPPWDSPGKNTGVG